MTKPKIIIATTTKSTNLVVVTLHHGVVLDGFLVVLHQVDDGVDTVVHHTVVGLVDIHHGVVVDGFEVVDFVVVHSVW